MANPFLMMDDESLSQGNESNSNPFLTQESQDVGEYETDNPFMAQNLQQTGTPASATNPFADFGIEEQDNSAVLVATTVADIFGLTLTETTASSDMFLSNNSNEAVVTSAANTFQPINNGVHFFDQTIDDLDEETHAPQKPIDLNIKHPHNLAQNFDDTSGAYSSDDELKGKPRPPPRPIPPSKATQDLILSVADQLDQASSHLLGRIPATRTPSPVSVRDLHSPSPTPDAAYGDLLDCANPSGVEPDLIANVGSSAMNDNPFMAPTNFPPPKQQDFNRNHPPRPPPPRPAPPSKILISPTTAPPPPIATQSSTYVIASQQMQQNQPLQQSQEPDLFDIFGSNTCATAAKPAPKSKEDILSLFSTPVPSKNVQPDLLSDDPFGGNNDPIEDFQPLRDNLVTQQQQQQEQQQQDHQQQEHQQQEQTIVPQAAPLVTSPPEVKRAAPPTIPPQPVVAKQPVLPPQPVTAPIMDEKPTVVEIIHPKRAEIYEIKPQDTIPMRPPPPVSGQATPTFEFTEHGPELIDSDEEEAVLAPTVEQNIPSEEDQSQVDTSNVSTAASSEPSVAESNSSIVAAETSSINQQIDEFNDLGSQSVEQYIEPVLDFSLNDSASNVNPFAAADDDVYPIVNTEDVIIPMAATTVAPIVSNDNLDIFGLADKPKSADEFDAFAAKFDSVKTELKPDGFMGTVSSSTHSFTASTGDAWGDDTFGTATGNDGFGAEEGFDSFLALNAPGSTPFDRADSRDSDEGNKEFNVFIRPKDDIPLDSITPVLAPPPKSSQNNSIYSGDSSPRVNPFDKGFGEEVASAEGLTLPLDRPTQLERTDSQETPPTPLFDDDVSQPLEDFPRTTYRGDGWEMQLRQPNKKKITGQRFWKKIFLKLAWQGDNPVLQLYNSTNDKEPFQELPLQACYSVSDIGAQQYDQFGKIFTVKLQYIFYKERPGVRPGQVTKAERLTNKLSQFAAYAIQGDYQGVKEFGSDLKKLGLPVEHAPQISQLFKIGSHNFEDMKQFSVCVEEALYKLNVHRDRALTYKMEEVQVTAVDELYVEQDAEGHVLKQIARVRLFFLAFLSGMPFIELGVNDLWRQGKEVVGRHDIIPVVTEEWIRLEGVEFHTCVHQDEYEKSRIIRFQPPDACYIELMRFRVRPPKNRELPLQVKATWCVTGNRVELRADLLVPGFASRKLGQIPCEDVAIRFPIPECWIYLFRVEKHFRYGSVKSAHRRTGKVKGIERILGAVETLQESLIEVTSGQAKYEHHHRALVWRCPRLPKEGQGAYTTHQLVCRLALTSYDQVPPELAQFCFVEFTMPATQVSHTTVRSVSVQESDSDDPPEKYVRYLARHEYKVGIEHTTGDSVNPYLSATIVKPIREEPTPQPVSSPMAPSDSDSESN